MNTVTQLKTALRAGIDVTSHFRAALMDLPKAIKELDDTMSHFSRDTLIPLAPAIANVKDEVRELLEVPREEGGEGGENSPWAQAFSKLLSPVRFIALTRALHGVQRGFRAMFSGGNIVGKGMAQVGEFVDMMNNMNRVLGLDRDSLHKLKDELADIAKGTGGILDPAEIASGFAALKQAGMSNTGDIKELAVTMGYVASQTDISIDSFAQLAAQIKQTTKLGNRDIDDFAAGLVKTSRMANVDAGQLAEAVKQNVGALAFLTRQDAATQAATLRHFTGFTAAVESQAGGVGGPLGALLAKASANNEAAQQLGQLSNMPLDVNRVQSMLTSGHGLSTMLRGISANVRSGKAGTETAIQEMFGGAISPEDLNKLAMNVDKIIPVLDDMDKSEMEAGKGLEYLKKGAEDMLTPFQKFEKRVTNAVGSLHAFGLSGTDVINFLHDFNLQTVASVGYLGRLIGALPGLRLGFKGRGECY